MLASPGVESWVTEALASSLWNYAVFPHSEAGATMVTVDHDKQFSPQLEYSPVRNKFPFFARKKVHALDRGSSSSFKPIGHI